MAFGDELEISFALEFSMAAVARRPDKATFEFVELMFFSNAAKKQHEAPSWCSPGRIKVTQDNQKVTFRATLADPGNPTLFARDELWGVVAQYRGEDGSKSQPEYSLPLGDFKFL
ncbi:MAG: hypothetical protein H7066_17905 [Cytophagaceae bacterium]|nr:hypothetical protein [Gemmatimonadaceae bacterium]